MAETEKGRQKPADKVGYKETKTAPNLKSIVINDPYDILVSIFGDRYRGYRSKWKDAGDRKYVPDFPIHVDIDITDFCNLSCKYCLQYTRKGWTSFEMEVPMFRKIIEELDREGAYSINIGWNAEPLINKKQFYEIMDIIDRSNIMDVFIHTNAVNLSEDLQKRIVSSKVTTICFSLGAVNDETRKNVIDRIKSSIVSFRKLRDSLGKKTPIIRISMIPTEENRGRIKEYTEFWKRYADYIEFQDVASLENKAGKKFRKVSFMCSDPWKRLSITSNGDIYPCCAFTCFSRDLKLGNIKSMTIKEAWDSGKIKGLREQLKSGKCVQPGCKQCMNAFYSADVG